jgi:hypothetical protein
MTIDEYIDNRVERYRYKLEEQLRGPLARKLEAEQDDGLVRAARKGYTALCIEELQANPDKSAEATMTIPPSFESKCEICGYWRDDAARVTICHWCRAAILPDVTFLCDRPVFKDMEECQLEEVPAEGIERNEGSTDMVRQCRECPEWKGAFGPIRLCVECCTAT